MLFPTDLSLERVDLTWTAVYCKPRQEKALANDLVRKEIAYFLPMVLRETTSGGRRRRNLYPLFPSYLFFAGGEAERLAVLKTDRTVRLIEIGDAEQPRFRQEIAALEKGEADKADNVLKNAPHTSEEVCANEWHHTYPREQAAFPVHVNRDWKYWPTVSRVDNALGDRNLICTCPPIEEYAMEEA